MHTFPIRNNFLNSYVDDFGGSYFIKEFKSYFGGEFRDIFFSLIEEEYRKTEEFNKIIEEIIEEDKKKEEEAKNEKEDLRQKKSVSNV